MSDYQQKVSERSKDKVFRRLIPFLMALMFVAYLDRISISYAGPNGMSADLGLSAKLFGTAAGIFFLGYILFEIPSQAMLLKFGARRWIARIMATWGVVQALMAFAPNADTLIGLRFLLGVAEAGFAPAIIAYLALWVPARNRGAAITLFLASTPIASILGAPVAQILVSTGTGSLAGWRVLFFVTGMLAVVCAILVLKRLPDHPRDARWLTSDEKKHLIEESDVERQGHRSSGHRFTDALKDYRAWVLGLGYFGLAYSAYALTFFLPSLVKAFQSSFGIGFAPGTVIALNATPFVVSLVSMLAIAHFADKFQKTGLFIMLAAAIGSAGSLISAFAQGPLTTMVGMCFIATGFMSAMPLYFNLLPRFFNGAAAAAGIALVNSVGLVGGFSGPIATGWIIDATGSYRLCWFVTAAIFLLSGFIALLSDRFSDPHATRGPAVVRIDPVKAPPTS
ncbi:hypothetical protein CIC12_29020 [Burkholderia sp. SG-MS1]|uniref:MFS transporter n=1 Tax=Paraburkholderia sp. SG-MS1 TaxID=2023741 RepID=UPI0014457B2C|nr:MFS transporter [Paraburkholderia sp. SG-MS1]NKJ50694.1 hypothetical protein [Paraburkholderia sp. SG-MS1]